MSLLIRIALLLASGWTWQYITSGTLLIAVLIGTVLGCFWIQFKFERN